MNLYYVECLKMVEIEDRGRTFRSWKAYAKALEKEVKCLQQFLSAERVQACAKAVGCKQ